VTWTSFIIASRQKLTNVCFMSTSVSFFFLLVVLEMAVSYELTDCA
jgi:hypothetical protein